MFATVRNDPLPLDRTLVESLSRESLQLALRKIVCSVRFEYLHDACALRLLGPEMSYHLVDPHLAEGLRKIRSDLTVSDVLSYRSHRRNFDLCFEDSWSGYFIARRCEQWDSPDELVLIHLDDHTDMMSTLLYRSGEALLDPTTGEIFDPRLSSHWQAAIYAGAVNIGNFMTPWFYCGSRVHVRHLNNISEDAGAWFVTRESRRYDLIPGKEFAALGKASESAGSCGTCLTGIDPYQLLRELPRARTLVHLDLDYFINDFNGASRGDDYVPESALRTAALAKINRFFDAMHGAGANIDRWLIAMSPGFCCAHHWDWLLAELDQRIHAYQEKRDSRMG